MNGLKLSSILPTVSGEMPKKSLIYGWSLKDFQIELLKAFVEPSLPFPIGTKESERKPGKNYPQVTLPRF